MFKFKFKPHQNFILPAVKKIYVIGDIHGDINAILNILIHKIKVLTEKHEWIGGKSVIVQLGDQVDGCRKNCSISENNTDDIAVLKLMTDLHIKASKHGGAVHSLLGNHEIMNVQQNFNYVSKQSNGQIPLYEGINGETKYISRQNAFKQGGIISSFMAETRRSALIIGSWIFIHGGIHHKNANFKEINHQIYNWLMNKTQDNYQINRILNDPELSIFWNRTLAEIKSNLEMDDESCIRDLEPILRIYPNKKIIVGHTVQTEGITSTCSNNIYRADTGISDAFEFSEKKKMILSITNNETVDYIEV